MKKRSIFVIILPVCIFLVAIALVRNNSGITGKFRGEDKKLAKYKDGETFDKSRYSINDPSSIWVIVNKKRPLPGNYEPSDLIAAGNGEFLRNGVASSLSKLIRSARQEGISLRIISGYRSYGTQESLYSSYVQTDGQNDTDNYSARPGHSEHQTGLAADLGSSDGYCDLDICFSNTASGKWLAKNSYKFGFIVRYEQGKESITGYQAEPWHLRYAGKELAKELHGSGLTMEEFFGLPPAPSY